MKLQSLFTNKHFLYSVLSFYIHIMWIFDFPLCCYGSQVIKNFCSLSADHLIRREVYNESHNWIWDPSLLQNSSYSSWFHVEFLSDKDIIYNLNIEMSKRRPFIFQVPKADMQAYVEGYSQKQFHIETK